MTAPERDAPRRDDEDLPKPGMQNMPYPSAYEAEPLDSAKRRALGTDHLVWYGIPVLGARAEP